MKHIANLLIVLNLVSCGQRIARIESTASHYSGSADARVEDADDCINPGDDVSSSKKSDDSSKSSTPSKTDPKTEDVSKDTKEPDPKPVDPKPEDPVVTPTPAPEVDARAESIKAMLAAKKMVSEFTVTDANSWSTSKDKRIELFIAVDAKGKAIVPSGISNPEMKGSVDGSADGSFSSSLHSTMKICNQAKADIRLHAEPGLPFEHGANVIKKGACTIYLLKNANDIKDGKSWDHMIGSQLPVFFKITRIKPDGSEA